MPMGARTQLTFYRDPVERRPLPAGRSRPGALRAQRGRRGELPALPARPQDRPGAALHRRHPPLRLAALVARRQAPRLRQQRPQRPRHGRLRGRSRDAGERAAARRGPGLLVAARLEPGQPPPPALRVHLRQRGLSPLGGRGGRRDPYAHSAQRPQGGRADRRLPGGPVVEGRPVGLYDLGPRQRVSAARAPRRDFARRSPTAPPRSC